MTKKQKQNEKSKRAAILAALEFEQKHPIHYKTHEEATHNENPIFEGEPGYEEAAWSTAIIAF